MSTENKLRDSIRSIVAASMSLSIEVVMHDGIRVIYCRGRILSGETEELRAAVLEAIESTGRVILELQSVKMIDSTGLGLLASLCLSARKRSGDVKLVKPSPHVVEVLEITMLGRLFTVYPTVEVALAAFSGAPHVTAQSP